MKKLILIIIFCISAGMLQAQKDLIITTKSDTIHCTIDKNSASYISMYKFSLDSIKYKTDSSLSAIATNDVKIYHNNGDFYYYLINGKEVWSSNKLQNYETLKPIQKNKDKTLLTNNNSSQVLYETGHHLRNACTYHFLGLFTTIGGAVIMTKAKESGGIIAGGIVCTVGFVFDIAAWSNIGIAGKSLQNNQNKNQLSLNVNNDGIGLAYKF